MKDLSKETISSLKDNKLFKKMNDFFDNGWDYKTKIIPNGAIFKVISPQKNYWTGTSLKKFREEEGVLYGEAKEAYNLLFLLKESFKRYPLISSFTTTYSLN